MTEIVIRIVKNITPAYFLLNVSGSVRFPILLQVVGQRQSRLQLTSHDGCIKGGRCFSNWLFVVVNRSTATCLCRFIGSAIH